MSKILKLKKGASIIEYMIVILFIVSVFFVFQNYILRGFSGRWRAIGDTFGSGKQYDPKAYGEGGTLECFYYQNMVNAMDNFWVATRCYEDCLRGRNGFGNAPDMIFCRTDCNEKMVGYEDCRDTEFVVEPAIP